eukprot:8511667-Alexandrium_andersonii.AAC.1
MPRKGATKNAGSLAASSVPPAFLLAGCCRVEMVRRLGVAVCAGASSPCRCSREVAGSRRMSRGEGS